MTMVKALFVLATLTLGTEALAQESCDPNEMDLNVATFAYADLDGSGKLDEIVLSSNAAGDATIQVAFDVPEKRTDEYSSYDSELALEIQDGDGDGRDELSLVVQGKPVGVVEGDWETLGRDSCNKEDYEPDAHVTYRLSCVEGTAGPSWFPMGPIGCTQICKEWEDVLICKRSTYVCGPR